MYKVLITTSGIGSRLGEYTKYTNKSLIRIGKKAALSYLIESYPKDTEFVITLGYYGEQVREFLLITYPKIKFTFVQVDKYKGEGSSLGYSMLKASKFLNSPFIFHASDTIVLDKVLPPQKNWIGGYKGPGSSSYTSFNILNGKIEKIMEKGILDPDYLHIGLVGIKDHEKFWKELRQLYKKFPNDQTLADVDVLNEMISNGIDFDVKEFKTWHDIGNAEALNRAREEIKDSFYNLDKPDESIFIYDKFVVKFFYDQDIVKQKVKRAKILEGLTPPIITSTNNFFSYKYIDGDLLADVANPINFKEFLNWCEKNLWIKSNEVDQEKFKDVCYDFYNKKTLLRAKSLLKKYSLKDEENIINDVKVPSLENIFKKINFDWLSNAEQTSFHGDLILDNVIKANKRYYLLDWRQNFGGLFNSGDMYYDLAKLNHNLTINHKIINEKLFKIEVSGKNIVLDIHRRENLIECQEALFDFILEKKYDLNKVKILTPLVWINSSPLHSHPYDLFLYYFGKYNLWKTINEK